MKVDLRGQLRAAEERLGRLAARCEELHEKNEERCSELVKMIEAGTAVEGDLREAQTDGEWREGMQQRAVVNYEECVVRPLRRRVQQLEVDEARAEIARLDREAAEARAGLEEFLKRAGEEERVLRLRVGRAEEESARLQRKVRRREGAG